ncbi:hypothetical protein PSHT_08881, partial [Puccinia striiformis]
TRHALLAINHFSSHYSVPPGPSLPKSWVHLSLLSTEFARCSWTGPMVIIRFHVPFCVLNPLISVPKWPQPQRKEPNLNVGLTMDGVVLLTKLFQYGDQLPDFRLILLDPDSDSL